ncbi:Rap1-interacting factor 1 N terminal-domain-containing protein [Chaetomidium leptoderma]|uniref:Rap1-interacting factor 1 N terminal-domain-containing protein n=1 Tax=Chaetomidium leptoderma TaxID=669021 RepID=A0AAN6VKL6_9PEZI|nr:Rap1-interacting factor 1 N terminal-domain-containing protein [Chaetomidium leptoderma]
MSSPAVLSSFLSSLPQRPPTPPREAHHEVAAPIRPPLGSIDTRLSLHTPPGFQSPTSSIATTSTSRRIRKKVGFSAQAEYKDPPVYIDGEGVRQHPTPVSLSRSASKPAKSILKVTTHASNLLDSTTGSDDDPSNPQASLGTMLESTLQQLAGGDRDSKLDAYLMLTRAWKASNNLPDRMALQEKMTLFTQFMQRDIVAKTAEGNVDTSLVNHALNLLNTFLHFPAIASTISNDFGVFVIDHCIRSFEDASTPKDTARRLMQVISLQNFSSKVMTPDRVGRLVSSLHSIEEHLKGKSIVLSRVLIYRKLVQQSRQLMIVHSDWLLDLFTDMLSNLKDIRSAAISLGLEAAFSIGHEKQLSRKVMEVFNLSYEDRRYIQYYEEKLKAMTKGKHESAIVPEIWSVVILLLRIRLDKWEYAGPWLHIIQNCFNTTDFPTKIAANHAWARLVYLMHLEERALPKNLATLTTPLISQLRRKGSGRTSEELRQAVLGGICNLFYYAFKPNTTSALLDTYWDTSVRPVLAKLLDPTAEAAEDNLRQASAILGGLFDCTTPRRWRVDHIVETSLVKPEELPAIDPKWIRHNTNRVFSVVEPILEQDFVALARTDTATHNLWRTLVSTVASAAAKEIKVSKDTALFVAEALRALQKIWKRGLLGKGETGHSVGEFLLSVRAYLEVMISFLGLLPFTEKAGKHQTPAKAPLYALFSMFSALPPGVPDGDDFAEFFGSIFAPFFASKGDKAKMDLAQDLISTIPMDAPRPYGTWLLVAENISSWLEPNHNSHHSTVSAGETPIGHDYRDIVKVLERGIRSTPNLPPKPWESLFYSAFERVREETGDAGAAIVVIEPLAKVLVEQFVARATVDNPHSCVKYVAELLSVATQPRDKQAVDAARKRLWGTVLAGSRSSSFDTFDNLYKAVNEVLEYSYGKSSTADSESTVLVLKELGGFFDRCNPQLFLKAMLSVQDGFLPWFEDNKRLLGKQTNPLFAATKSLWDKVSQRITDLEHPEQQLQFLDRFFCASFASCHRSIVNSTIALWNRLFENVGHLDYPEELKAALVQMQLHADIVLPGLDTSSTAEYAGQQPSFIDSFVEDFSLPRLPSTRSSSRRATPRPASSQSKSPASLKLTRRHRARSPPRKPAATNRGNATPRLRHDDSQVQFAAIDPSSALGSPVESQVLTERQREVRDRQRENAALFSDIRPSSPDVKPNESGRQMLPVGPRTRQATTPEPERGFDDYVSSTPTPRRGQLMVMPEHDMTDPPSSPPELRGNPLAAEIRSRSASHSLLEDWQFSSSPVSGSPNPNRHGIIPDPSNHRGYVSVVSLPEVEDDGPSVLSSPEKGEEREAPQPAVDEVIEDSMILGPVKVASAPEPSEKAIEEGPSTPRRSSRLSQSRVGETSTPKSDGEEFVDAPTSPLPATPKRAAEAIEVSEAKQMHVIPADSNSFDMSDVDESSLLRLVVELDSSKADRTDYHRSSVSPGGKGQLSPVIDCIVVGDSPKKSEVPPPLRKTRASSAASSGAEPQNIPSSQPTPRAGRAKRKRASSKVQETNPKKQRHDSVEESGEVLDSQTAPAPGTSVEVHASGEVPGVILEDVTKDDEIIEERIPSSSAEPSNSESSSQESGSQDSAVPETGDAMEVEGDDQDVQSQIALEFSHSQRQEEDGMFTCTEESSPAPMSAEESMQAGIQQPITVGEVEDGVANNMAGPVMKAEEATSAGTNQVPKIMGLLRGGLGELRSARLSRDEVYQIEDMLMDMKRELYEAERRGRS